MVKSNNSITKRIRKFKKDLRDKSISNIKIVRKYIHFGTPYIFEGNETLYYDLKEEIAEHFKISPSNVFMIGSAKLGFCLSVEKGLWRYINEESDIDMTIISEKLFDEIWKEIFEFNINITVRTEKEDKQYHEFLKYFFKGWIRPDKFPFNFAKKVEIQQLLNSLYNKYDNRKVSVGIFRNEYFFEMYHVSNINKIREIVI